MNNRHLFILPPGLYRGANIDEINDTVSGLVEMDLFRLPYERDVYIQMLANDCANPPPGLAPLDRHIFMVLGPYGKDQVPDLLTINAHTGYSISLLNDPMVSAETIESSASVIAVSQALLIVLLATRNVIKTTKENKLAKLGIGKSNFRNRFAYTTTISIPAALDDDPDHPGGAAKCPHLRRGHIRRQHYGPGGQYERKIWIDPIFVNADPDFVNQRRAYNLAVPA